MLIDMVFLLVFGWAAFVCGTEYKQNVKWINAAIAKTVGLVKIILKKGSKNE